MSPGLEALTRGDLEALAAAVQAGRLAVPPSAAALRRLVPEALCEQVAAELGRLVEAGMTAQALALVLRMLAREREARQRESDRVQLVWTGPLHAQSSLRDTAVVVEELLGSAQRSVLLVSYVVHRARELLAPLAERMEALPELRVRMFLNVARPQGSQASEAELLREFLEEFREREWPGRRLPELYYDPRALAEGPGPRASLHAKCIVVDEARALVTSANFTEAARLRNIELGVLVEDERFARTLRRHVEALVDNGTFLPVPGCAS